MYYLFDIGTLILALCFYGAWGFIVCGSLLLVVGVYFVFSEGLKTRAYFCLAVGSAVIITGIALYLIERNSIPKSPAVNNAT